MWGDTSSQLSAWTHTGSGSWTNAGEAAAGRGHVWDKKIASNPEAAGLTLDRPIVSSSSSSQCWLHTRQQRSYVWICDCGRLYIGGGRISQLFKQFFKQITIVLVIDLLKKIKNVLIQACKKIKICCFSSHSWLSILEYWTLWFIQINSWWAFFFYHLLTDFQSANQSKMWIYLIYSLIDFSLLA